MTKKLSIQSIPADLYENLKENDCTIPNHCYANCANVVMNLDLAQEYVLCFIEEESGDIHGHAVLKVDGKYYDPTLYKTNRIMKNYWAHSEFSKVQLILFIKNWYGDNLEYNSEGVPEMYPPALMKDGTVQCLYVAI